MVFQGAMNAFNPVKRIGEQIDRARWSFTVRATGQTARRQGAGLAGDGGHLGRRPRPLPARVLGGMRQRRRSRWRLACQPKVLLADEPTTALDVMVQAQIFELLVPDPRPGASR